MDMDHKLLKKEEREVEEKEEVREDEQEKGEDNINPLSPWTLLKKFMNFFIPVMAFCNTCLLIVFNELFFHVVYFL